MLQSANFSTNYRVYYEDTDAGGVVYYANYLKFFERCRTDFLRAKGINQNELAQNEGVVFVVKKCNIDYISPARLDDLIEVSVKVKEIRSASIIMDQEVSLNGETLATLEVVIVCVDSTSFRPKKIPNDLIPSPANKVK